MDNSPITPTAITAAADECCAAGGKNPGVIGRDKALLLDLDGTLLELADTPGGVRCPADLPGLLGNLSVLLDGAVAIVTGRSLEFVDALFRPLLLPGAGIYGAEMRLRAGAAIEAPDVPEIAPLVRQLRDYFSADSRIVVEDKRSAVALHFRLAPERGDECRRLLGEQAACPPLKIVEGKCVVEACSAAYDKGSTVVRIMAAPPFLGRKPIFIGDDRSDEAAFGAAADFGGYGVKVGDGTTAAPYRIRSVGEVQNWLRSGLLAIVAEQP